MELFPLQIFPQGTLSSAVVTTVWVGVFVVAFFNLRLGWVLSGLVVPGYMVPLLIVKPWSAGVVLLEALVTFLLVAFLSERFSHRQYWSSLFGRDRFFMLVLTSVAVRIVFDGWLLPAVGEWLVTSFAIEFDYRSNLHSFGLIIISLIANQLWKTGLVRGAVPLFVTLGITYLIVRFGLMEFTNFTMSNLGYLYEDIASSILASPKAYILLIVAAFIASRMNLRYGWEHSGILIPSLLALQWYQPLKILTTFVEAFVILGLAMLVLRAPIFAHANIEGARKLLLFFNIGFFYKWVLGFVMLWYFPEVKATDAYGFGYLLATLMAIKMHDKGIALRLTRSTLQTSLTAVVVGSGIGFALTLLPLVISPVAVVPGTSSAVIVAKTDSSLVALLREDKVGIYRSRVSAGMVPPLPHELDAFERGMKYLQVYVRDQDPVDLQAAVGWLEQANYKIDRVEDRYLYINEKQPAKGWGTYVLDTRPRSQLVIEVVAPVDEWGTSEVGAWMFMAANARALAIAGAARNASADKSSDVLLNRQTIFAVFHRRTAKQDVVQLRGYTADNARLLAGIRKTVADIDLPLIPSALWVKGALPPGLDLVRLKKLTGELAINWGEPPLTNRLRDSTTRGFAELFLNRSDMRSMLAKSRSLGSNTKDIAALKNINGYLKQWLLEGKNQLASRGTNLYVPPATEELLFFDEEIISPLLKLGRGSYAHGRWSRSGMQELRTIAANAAVLGYQLINFHDRETGGGFLVLHAINTGVARKYWGTYVYRLGAAGQFVVQVPRPLYEINSFDYGITLFEQLQARALHVAGAHPETNLDGTADLIKIRNRVNLFNLANQVILRESGDEPIMTVHSRAFGARADSSFPQVDALVSFSNGARQISAVDTLGKQLLSLLARDGFSTRIVDGSPETSGYGIGSVPQSMYLQQTLEKQFAIMWVSPLTRAAYSKQSITSAQAVQFRAVGIATIERDLDSYIAQHYPRSLRRSLPPAARSYIENYMERQDINSLQGMLFEGAGLQYRRIIDRISQQSFLAVLSSNNRLYAIANLAPRNPTRQLRIRSSTDRKNKVAKFIKRRAGWLLMGGR